MTENHTPLLSPRFCRSEGWAWQNWVLCSGFHKTDVKVLAGLQAHLELEVLFQAYSGCWQNPVSCRTEGLVPYWLSVGVTLSFEKLLSGFSLMAFLQGNSQHVCLLSSIGRRGIPTFDPLERGRLIRSGPSRTNSFPINPKSTDEWPNHWADILSWWLLPATVKGRELYRACTPGVQIWGTA